MKQNAEILCEFLQDLEKKLFLSVTQKSGRSFLNLSHNLTYWNRQTVN